MTTGGTSGSRVCTAERLEQRRLLAATVLEEVITDFGESEVADDVAPQRDGRVVVLGHTENAPDGGRMFLARYDVDGTLDDFFGENGRIFGEFPNFRRANAMAVDRSGRIYVAGVTDGTDPANPDPTAPLDPAVAVVRFTRAGFLDRSYGDGGLATLQAGTGEVVNDVAVDASGRAVVAGQTIVTTPAGTNATLAFMAARFDASGRPDLTFGGIPGAGQRDGVAAFPVGIGESGANGVAIDDNGRVVLGGFADEQSSGQPPESRFALARLERTGTLDEDFGAGEDDGIVTLDVGLPSTVQGVALGRNGKVVAAGNTLPDLDAEGEQILVARFDSGGALDASFGGGDGFTLSGFGGARSQIARDVAIDSSDRVLVAGEATDTGSPTGDLNDDQFLLARYLSDGTPDTAFAPGGGLLNEVQPGLDSFEDVAGLAQQPGSGKNKGRVFVAGTVGPNATARDLAVVRYATDATTGTGSARLNGRKLVVKGTDRADVIAVSRGLGGTIDVNVNGAVQSFPLSAVGRIEVGSKDGDDEVTCSAPREIVTVLLGGDDDDDLRLLGDAEGRVEGGDGDDDLTGGIYSDRLRGGDGDDILFGGDGDDDLDGGDGFDRIFGEDGDDDLKADDGFSDDLDGGDGDDDARVDFFDFFTRIDDVHFE